MMRNPKENPQQQEGVALVVFAGLLVVLLVVSGLSIDLGRAYIVKAQLTKAVDGAALAGARALSFGGTGTPEKDEASRIFTANFQTGYLGTNSVTNPTTDPNFFSKVYDATTGSHIITVKAHATLPATFMRLVGFGNLTVSDTGEARRRLVDLSLAIDCSGSLSGSWSTVQAAANRFINSFDEQWDRMAVTLFSDGAQVLYAMPATRGFNKTAATNAVSGATASGSTSMADGFYRAWDELRSVPLGSQAGLRVIVLFTDGTPNGLPGHFLFSGTDYVRQLNTNDFPAVSGVSSSNTPDLFGLALMNCDQCSYNPSFSGGYWQSPSYTSTSTSAQVPWMPAGAVSTHPNQRSFGIPTSFPLQSATLKVNGVTQSTARDLRNFNAGTGKYPADIHNVNNAGRNVLEIIADTARNDASGDYPIRVYTIGMGASVTANLGTIPEKSSDILKRISNDRTSVDYNSNQIAGKYYYAQTASDVDPAFQALRNELIRITK